MPKITDLPGLIGTPTLDDLFVMVDENSLPTAHTDKVSGQDIANMLTNDAGFATAAHIQKQDYTFATDFGTTDAFEITIDPTVMSYAQGLRVTMLSQNSNTVFNPSINVNALGPITITRGSGNGLAVNDIQPNLIYDLVYNAGTFTLLNPSTGALADQRAAGNAAWFTSTDNGIVNAYQIDLPVYLAGAASGFVFMRAANTNTGPAILTVTDLSSNLQLGQIAFNGAPLVGGEIVAQHMYGFLFNPGTGEWDLLNSSLTPSFTWIEVTGTSASMLPNHGYIANNAGLVTLTLPATFAVGDEIKVAGLGSGGWAIAQNASQQIHLGSSATTAGVGGSLASTNRYDSINLLGAVTDLTLTTQGGPQGVITVV